MSRGTDRKSFGIGFETPDALHRIVQVRGIRRRRKLNQTRVGFELHFFECRSSTWKQTSKYYRSVKQKPIIWQIFCCLGQQLKFFDLVKCCFCSTAKESSHGSIIFRVRHLFLIHVFRSKGRSRRTTTTSNCCLSSSFVASVFIASEARCSQGFHPPWQHWWPTCTEVRLGVNNMVTTCFKNLPKSGQIFSDNLLLNNQTKTNKI